MQTKILLRQILLLVAAITLVFFLVFLFYFIPRNPIQSSTAGFIKNSVISSEQEQKDFGLPTRLKIPKINVEAAVEQVGLIPNGEMDIPKNQDDVAWFKLGPRSGENGSAVDAGHYGWKDGEPAVFDNLYKLRKGDKLYIEDDQGVIISFVVRAIRRFDPKADASDVFISSDGQSHLNLITCEGTWDKTSESYSQRLVIFTDKK